MLRPRGTHSVTKPPTIRHTIRGKPWRTTWRRLKADDGACHFDSRLIVLHAGLAGQDLLDAAAHEVLHAALPDLDEPAVDETAGAVAELLWRLGYRRCDLGQDVGARK